MNYKVSINIPLSNNEVPELSELAGWGGRDEDYQHCFIAVISGRLAIKTYKGC